MNKIDTSGWKPFRICDIFETEGTNNKLHVPTGSWLPIKKLKDGTTPRITVSGLNNGVSGYYSDIEGDNYRVYENFISVSFLGTVFYQSGKASLDMKVHCLKLIKYTLNDNVACFLIAMIRRAVGSVEYSDQISSAVLPYIEILLPATQSGNPDWAYMDSFMQNVMNESKACLGNLRLAKASKSSVDISTWKNFEIGSLFDIVKGTRLTKANMKPGDIRFIGSSAMNNGWTTSIKNDEHLHPANTLTVCYNGSVGETFYQDAPFWASDDVNVLYPKFKMNERIGMFIAPLIRSVGQRYAFVDKWRMEVMEHGEIKLPVDEEGIPDWAYMDLHMEAILTQSKKSMDALKEVTL